MDIFFGQIDRSLRTCNLQCQQYRVMSENMVLTGRAFTDDILSQDCLQNCKLGYLELYLLLNVMLFMMICLYVAVDTRNPFRSSLR